MVLLALNPRDAAVTGFSLPEEFHPHTFVEAWQIAQLSTYMRTSVIVSFFVVVGTTVLSILAGYAFGTMRFRGSDWLFYLMLIGMILPTEAIVVPLYYDLRAVGMTNTYAVADPSADRAQRLLRDVLDAGLLPLGAQADARGRRGRRGVVVPDPGPGRAAARASRRC